MYDSQQKNKGDSKNIGRMKKSTTRAAKKMTRKHMKRKGRK